MTPEDIARERANAMQEMRTDYSPVASPWQGLARVAQNLMGAIDSRRADTASAANATDQQRIVAALMGGPQGMPQGAGATPPIAGAPSAAPAAPIDAGPAGMGQVANTVGGLTDTPAPASGMAPAPAAAPGAAPTQPTMNPAIVQAMTSPYVSDDVRKLATIQYRDQLERARYQAPEAPEFVRLILASGADPNSAASHALIARDLENRADPVVTVPLPDGRTYVGPRSAMQAALGGGTVSHGAPPPPTLPSDFQFPEEGGPGSPAPATFPRQDGGAFDFRVNP